LCRYFSEVCQLSDTEREMLRQCSYRGVRYACAVGLPAPAPFPGAALALRGELLEPLGIVPARCAATLPKLTNTMQPEEIRLEIYEMIQHRVLGF
jgi:hypothetical protein